MLFGPTIKIKAITNNKPMDVESTKVLVNKNELLIYPPYPSIIKDKGRGEL